MGYDQTEIEAAVTSLTTVSPTFGMTELDTRDVVQTYESLTEMVRIGLFYESDAIFYLIKLSASYWCRTVKNTLATIDEMVSVLDDLWLKDRPIEQVSSILSAANSLDQVSGALNRQGTIAVQSYRRYLRHMDKALNDVSRSVRVARTPIGGTSNVVDIARARTEAVAYLEQRIPILLSGHQSILGAVEQLKAAFGEYLSANLVAAVGSGQVTRSAESLRTLYETVEGLDPLGRTAYARDATLTLLSTRSTMQALVNRKLANAPRLEADGTDYRISAYGTGTAPYVEGTISSPWPLVSGVTHNLEVDFSGTTVLEDLTQGGGYSTGTRAAEVIGSRSAPNGFPITSGLGTPHPLLTKEITSGADYAVNGKALFLIVDGVAYEVAFSANRNATEVASDINAAVPTVNATPVSGGGNDWVSIAYDNASPPDLFVSRFMRVATGVDSASDLGPWRTGPAGADFEDVTRGVDANNTLLVQANSDASSTTVTLGSGAWPTYLRAATDVRDDIIAQGAGKFTAEVRDDRIVIKSLVSGEGSSIQLLAAGLSSGLLTASHRALRTLGFDEYQVDRASDVSALTVAGALNRSTAFKAVGQASLLYASLLESQGAVVSGASQLTVALDEDPLDGVDLTTVKLAIRSGENGGVYGISSKGWSSPNLTLNLSRALRDTGATNRLTISVYEEHLVITSKDNTQGSSLTVSDPTQSAHGVLGLSLGTVNGTVEELLIERSSPSLGWSAADLAPNRIQVGDVIYDENNVEVTRVASVANVSEGRLGVEPVLSDFSLSSGFTILSSSGLAYDALETGLRSWSSGLAPYNDEDLGRVVTPLRTLMRSSAPSKAQVTGVYNTLLAYRSKLVSLQTTLTGYEPRRLLLIEDIVRTLIEFGMDRARDLLLQGYIKDFFELTIHGASYGRSLMRATNLVVVEDANEPTMYGDDEETEFDRFVAGWEEDTDPSYILEDEEELPYPPYSNYSEV